MKNLLLVLLYLSSSLLYGQYNYPEGAITKKLTIQNNHETIGSDHKFVKIWFAASTLKYKEVNDGYILMDYFKLFQIDNNGNRTLIDWEYFDEDRSFIDSNNGYLCSRNPYAYRSDFCTDKSCNMDNAYVQNGKLVVFVGKHGDLVSHWWGHGQDRVLGYKYEVVFKIFVHGSIAIEAGLDYCLTRDGSEGRIIPEPWISDWYLDTQGQEIIVTTPNFPKSTNNNTVLPDYGVSVDGKFFISDALVQQAGGTDQLYIKCNETNWNDTPMYFTTGNYWVFDSRKNFSISSKVEYCFHLDRNSLGDYLPHNILDKVNPADVTLNKSGTGYNFLTYPLK